MSNNEITTTNPAAASATVARHERKDPSGGSGARRELIPTGNAVSDRIEQILQLAHTRDPRDAAEYEKLQSVLLELYELKIAGKTEVPSHLLRGETRKAKVNPAAGMVPDRDGYPTYFDRGHFVSALWEKSTPKLHAAHVTFEQAEVLLELLTAADKESVAHDRQERERNARRVHAQTVAELRRQHGADYANALERGNEKLKQLSPEDSWVLANTRLEDGSLLGSNESFCRLLIALADEQELRLTGEI